MVLLQKEPHAFDTSMVGFAAANTRALPAGQPKFAIGIDPYRLGRDVSMAITRLMQHVELSQKPLERADGDVSSTG